MSLPRFHSYFWKILAIIGLVSVGFLFIVVSTLAYYMVVPLGNRATDDLAGVIIHAAETWDTLPPDERPDFAERILKKHELVITSQQNPLPKSSSLLPYLYFLERSLQRRLARVMFIQTSRSAKGRQWFWVDIPLPVEPVRIGFPRSRIGVNPPIVFFIILVTGSLLTLATAVILTRRLTVPIERLHQAVRSVGKGQWPEPIPEEGPEELVALSKQFNRMNIQVQELLANRTTLLAGIAHDLRTPLTQIQLALSMLPEEGGDPVLMESIRDDLNIVNSLIGEAVSIGVELKRENPEWVDVDQELENLVSQGRSNGAEINFTPKLSGQYHLQPMALRRVISNLLTNAMRYGHGNPVDVIAECDSNFITILINDNGPGIPEQYREAVFRPFYRLEKSRGSQTGGSGLGLAIVKQLVDANGWKVALISHSDAGTSARLTIPIE